MGSVDMAQQFDRCRNFPIDKTPNQAEHLVLSPVSKVYITSESIIVDNVIAFPTKSIRDRAEIERAILDVLQESGASPEETETIITNIKEFLELLELDFKFSFPDATEYSIQEQFKDFSAALHERTNRLIFERLKMEIGNVVSSRCK